MGGQGVGSVGFPRLVATEKPDEGPRRRQGDGKLGGKLLGRAQGLCKVARPSPLCPVLLVPNLLQYNARAPARRPSALWAWRSAWAPADLGSGLDPLWRQFLDLLMFGETRTRGRQEDWRVW